MEVTMKLKDLCFVTLAAYSLGGTAFTHGSQRFMNLARYATAAAAHCSQTFQTIKQSKQIQWVADHKVTLTRTGIIAGLVTHAAFESKTSSLLDPLHIPICHSEEKAKVPEPVEIRTRLEAFFASQGMTIKFNDPLCFADRAESLFNEMKRENTPLITLFLVLSHTFSSRDASNIALSFLNLYENSTLTAGTISSLLGLINEEKTCYVEKFVKNGSLEKVSLSNIESIFRSLAFKQQSPVALLFLQKSFDTLDESCTSYLMRKLSSKKDQLFYIDQFFKTKKIENTNPEGIDYLFFPFSPEEKNQWATAFLEKSFDRLSNSSAIILAGYCSKESQEFWIKKIAKKHPLFNLLIIDKAVEGPLFSTPYTIEIMRTLNIIHGLGEKKVAIASHIIKEVSLFTAEEYKKGNVVLYHGQSSQWAFFEQIFAALSHITNGTQFPENFVSLRHQLHPPVANDEIIKIRENGYHQSNCWNFQKLLFTTLHLFSNEFGGNPLLNAIANHDLSKNGTQMKTYIHGLFLSLGLEKEYEQLERENPNFINHLITLYEKTIAAKGDVGRVIAISIPPSIAENLCFFTSSLGALKPLTIKGKKTTSVVEISKNFSEVPADRIDESCLILCETSTNPEKAATAGIIMKTFTSEPTEESKKCAAELEAEITKVMNRIAELLKERMAKEGKSS